MPLAKTPEPPYYAVIFSSILTFGRTPIEEGYAQTADEMEALASEQPGYLGIESVRDEHGVGITVSYWESEEAIANWRKNADHLTAQRAGRERWYRGYVLRVARVERVRTFGSLSSE
jgi:heme-degrading monooxygenase HmoA